VRGTLTFLFTDVEGSTRLLREAPDEYAALLVTHRDVLRTAFRSHGGTEVDTQGDAFFVAFPSAGAAVAAAADAQRALAQGPIRVRMGIHTGEAEQVGEGYVGLEVHKGARVAASAHGGQVVVSGETRAVLDDDVELIDLGEHRLKDFDEPVWLFQLGGDPFPPLHTISNTNLPRPVSSFVGREREIADLVSRLRNGTRLLTLTGPGGTGKTRLAIEAAAELVPGFKAGVFWVGLAAVRDPGLVIETIARTLGARADLAAHVGERELLLVLDNLEQVVESAPELADLLERCANLRLLVTSRELLRVRGEVEYAVPPLAELEAVKLFTTRAQLEPDETVAELCAALDNLPLAVELAAARASVLSPAQIVERLSQRLDLLKGMRDADPRHQTLRATIEWSHQLLAPGEQNLFARLAVFAGGSTLGAAEDVVEADLDTMQALVEKSLLRYSDERFWMLETIREYAVERLDEDGAAEWRHRHAQHFLDFAERVEPELAREQQAEWLELTERDHPNLRLALTYFAEAGAWQAGLRLTAALRPFWFRKGHLSEGRRWLAQFLEAADEQTPARAKALGTAALLAALQGNWLEAKRWGTEGRRLGLELGEQEYACWSMLTLGRALLGLGDRAGAVALFEEAGRVARQNDDRNSIAHAAFNLGYTALTDGDLERARAEFEVAAENGREAQQAAHAGVNITARSLAALGSVALRDDRPAEAVAFLRDSLRTSTELRERDDTVAWALELLGAALSELDPERAVRLLGAAEALREELGVRLEGIELEPHERALAALRTTLNDDAIASAWVVGRRCPLHELVDEALQA